MSITPGQAPAVAASYATVPDESGGAAARWWWDAHAEEYLAEHGPSLGDADFVWGPEGLTEDEAHLLGELSELTELGDPGDPGGLGDPSRLTDLDGLDGLADPRDLTNLGSLAGPCRPADPADPGDLADPRGPAGRRVLEVGAGAAQCSRWLAARGVAVIATDISGGMLAAGGRLDASTGIRTQRVQADARALPFPDACFDVVFTAFGALPFVPDTCRVHREIARVLRPGGRWVFATAHPMRWPFPDDPGEAGLTAFRPYFDRTPYVETAADGTVLYVEYHRTLGDLVSEVTAAGLVIDALIEPEWPEGRQEVWAGWGPVRSAILPGTLIVQTHKPALRPEAVQTHRPEAVRTHRPEA